MDINAFKRAQEIRKKIEDIDFALSLLADNENNDYIVSYYDKTIENESDGNEVDINNNKKVNKYQITNELKSAIKESLFNQKMKLEEEFKSL